MQRQFTLIIIYMISPSATMYLDNLCRYQCRYLCRNLNRYLWMTPYCGALQLVLDCSAVPRPRPQTKIISRKSHGAELTFGPEYLETVTCEPLVARKQPRCL